MRRIGEVAINNTWRLRWACMPLSKVSADILSAVVDVAAYGWDLMRRFVVAVQLRQANRLAAKTLSVAGTAHSPIMT